MARIEHITDCRRGKHARKLAKKLDRERKDVHYLNGGSHVCVKVDGKGKTPIPRGEWSKGLRSAVIRQWKLLGIAVLVVGTILLTG